MSCSALSNVFFKPRHLTVMPAVTCTLYVLVVFHQKIVAFENAFDRLLEIITEEGYSDGGTYSSLALP